MTQLFVNNFATTVATTFGVADTTLTVASTTGLPALTGGDTLSLTVFRKTGVDEREHEVVTVTAWIDNALTVVRAVEGAAASQFLTGDRVEARLTATGLHAKADVAALTTHTSNTSNPHSVTKAQVGLSNVDDTADIDKPVSAAQATADDVARDAAKAYADTLVIGLIDDRGNFNASVNAYPSSGGSGTAGAILKGDLWTISTGGTLPSSQLVTAGDLVRSLVNTPGDTQSNWAVTENNIGYVAENSNNKVTSISGASTDTQYPSAKLTFDHLAGKAASLGADDNYVTDAEKVVIGNTSSTNTGDNSANSLYSGLVSNANHSGDATGATALTLATVNSNVGAFGGATNIPVVTVNAKGLVTAISTVAVPIPSRSILGSFHGVTKNTDGTSRFYFPDNTILTKIESWAGAAVPSNTSVSILKNGVAAGSCTINSGASVATPTVLSVALVTTDYITLNLTSAGASDVIARLTF